MPDRIILITYQSDKVEWLPLNEAAILHLHDNQEYMTHFDIVDRCPESARTEGATTYEEVLAELTRWKDALKKKCESIQEEKEIK